MPKRGLSRKAQRRELLRALRLVEVALLAEEEARSAKSEYVWGFSQTEQQLREELFWNPEYLGSNEFWQVVEEATEGLLQQSVEAEQSASQAERKLKEQLAHMRQLGTKASKDASSVDFDYRAKKFRITSSYL
jgi:hypothetical protein